MDHTVLLASASFTLAVIGPLSAWLHSEIVKHGKNDKIDAALLRIGNVAATVVKSIASKVEADESISQAVIESAVSEVSSFTPGAVKTLLADGMSNVDVRNYITHAIQSRLPQQDDLTKKLNDALDALLRSFTAHTPNTDLPKVS